MKVEIGKRYRFVPNEDFPHLKPEDVTVVDDGGLLRMTSEGAHYAVVHEDGVVPSLGRLVEIEPQKRSLHPILGDDPGAFADLVDRFKTWDFSTGTY